MLGDTRTLAYPDLLPSLKPHKRLGCKLLVLLGYLAFSSSLLVFVFATCPELQSGMLSKRCTNGHYDKT